MGRYLTALGRSFLVAAFAVFTVGLTASGALAQTAPSVVVFLDNGMLATAFDPICAQYAQLPPLANCTQSAASLTNISGDASSCLKQLPGHQLNFSITDPQLAALLAQSLAPFFQVTGLVNFLVFAVYPVTNSCTAPIYLSVHANGQWDSLADFGGIAAGATTDVVAGLLFVASPAGLLPDGVLACSSPPVQGASACPTGAPVAPSGCTLTANPSQLPAGGGSVTLTTACSAGDPPTSFAWTGPNVAPTTTGSSQKVNVTATSTFTVIASNAAGAAPAASATVTISSLSVPVCTLSASPSQLPAGGGTVSLDATCMPAATSYRWSGLGANPTAGASQQLPINTSSTFSVIGSNAQGSSAATNATVMVGSPKSYVFTTVGYPGGSSTDLLAFNSVGQVLGSAIDGNGQTINFVYQSGNYVPVPSPSGTAGLPALLAINDVGVMAGALTDPATNCAQGALAVQDELFATQSGFVLGGASYTFFTHPGYAYTQARGINVNGLVAGIAATDCNSPFSGIAFIYDSRSGQFTDIPFPKSTNTIAQGINAKGDIVGSITIPQQGRSGYVRTSDGTTTTFALNGTGDTATRGINDLGVVTGFGLQGTVVQAFVGNIATGFQLLNVPGAASTQGRAINNAGQVIGVWDDAAGGHHGFVATPITTPTGTTSGGAYTYSAAVTANTPIFVAPAVGSGFTFAVGAADPLFAAVQLPDGGGQGQYTVTVSGQSFTASGGDLVDFRLLGFANGVNAFSLSGIDTGVFSGAANARAFPIGLMFVGAGTFTGTQTPVGP